MLGTLACPMYMQATGKLVPCLVLGSLLLCAFNQPLPAQGYTVKNQFSLSRAHASFTGEGASNFAGLALANAGDVNGDGSDDILIGAPGASPSGTEAGRAYLLFGKRGGWELGLNLSRSDASFDGEAAGDRAGSAVSGAGDVNGDGYDDLLVCAEGNNQSGMDAGKVYLVFGRPSGWSRGMNLSQANASFLGQVPENYALRAVGAGDLNGDGYGDLAIAEPNNYDPNGTYDGMLYLFFGRPSGWAQNTSLATADVIYYGEGGLLGDALAPAGDVNGDGLDDLLVGAFANFDAGAQAGKAYLILGRTSGWTSNGSISGADASFLGTRARELAGRFLDGVGDVNGDGLDDIAIGASGNDTAATDAGKICIFFGRTSGWAANTSLSAADASFTGESAFDYAGPVRRAGDLDGDGIGDMLMGAPSNDLGGSDAGRAYVVLGKASGWGKNVSLSAQAASYIGEAAGDNASRGLASGDFNGDGRPDILISAFRNDGGGTNSGRCYLLFDYLALLAPQNLSISLTTDGRRMVLDWFDNRNPHVQFRVYRSLDGRSYARVAVLPWTGHMYNDTEAVPGREYWYIVTAYDPARGIESPMTSGLAITCDRDTDGDGTGDMADWDDDGDGVADGSDAFPLDGSETLDTDLDGIGNNADPDDDNDGLPDSMDAFPLSPFNAAMDNLAFLNATLRGLAGDITGLVSGLQSVNATSEALRTEMLMLGGNITSMWSDLRTVNTTVQAIRADLLVAGANLASMWSDLRTMNANLTAMKGELGAVNSSLQAAIASLSADLGGLNASLRAQLSSLDSRMLSVLEAQAQGRDSILGAIDGLSGALEAVNASLQAELHALGRDIDAYGAETAGALEDLALALAELESGMDSRFNSTEANLTTQLDAARAMLADLDNRSLGEVRQRLGDIETGLAAAGADASGALDTARRLTTSLEAFSNATGDRLENLSALLSLLGDIGLLRNRLETVDARVGSLAAAQRSFSEQQERTDDTVNRVTLLSYLGLALTAAVLVPLAIALAVRRRRVEVVKEATPVVDTPAVPHPEEPGKER
jgi:hypothetical protein